MEKSEEEAFLKMADALSDRGRKLLLACMKTYNRLPPEKRTIERLKQMLIAVGFEIGPDTEMTAH